MNDDELYNLVTSNLMPNMNDFSVLIDSVMDTFNSIVIPTFEQNMFDYVSQSIRDFGSVLDNLINDIDFHTLSESLAQLLESIEPTFHSVTTASPDNIVIKERTVHLSENTIETLSSFFDKNSDTPTPHISNKMPVKEFLATILLPILLALLPMMQTAYYHKLDSVAASTQQLQESDFQQHLLDVEKQHLEAEILQTEELQKQNEYLEQIIQLLTNELTELPEDTQASPEVSPTVPFQLQPVQLKPVPDPDRSAISPVDDNTVSGAFDNPGTDE